LFVVNDSKFVDVDAFSDGIVALSVDTDHYCVGIDFLLVVVDESSVDTVIFPLRQRMSHRQTQRAQSRGR